jgi:hypothetical protein
VAHLLGASLKLLALHKGKKGSPGRNALAYLAFMHVKKKMLQNFGVIYENVCEYYAEKSFITF